MIRGSLEEKLIRNRVDITNRQRLAPFFVVPLPGRPLRPGIEPVYYWDRSCKPIVLAEIKVYSFDDDEGNAREQQ